ncbi:acyltransferase [Metabacillus mangrovi]|uniref:acyltransferase n=1 Tax=Metabacillus mangrovi TaxID=1491830 RepID=UPI0012BA6459|nr:acyltransferase family protein [Metabacillus mangrovi]
MKKQRIYYFDWLRALATISVVILHAASPLLEEYRTIPAGDWWTGNTYDSMTRWCVPIFFMMSGALMLNPGKQESAANFIKKRASKVLIPFAAWTIFYLLVSMKVGDLEKNPEAAIKAVLSDNVYYHLWFLYVMIGLYAITPILRVYILHASRKNIELFLFLWFICTAVFSLISKLYDVEIGFEAFPASGYIGYFVMGYYLHKYSFKTSTKAFIYGLGATGLLLTIFATWALTEKSNGVFDGFFYKYLNVSVIFMSAAVFLFFKDGQKYIKKPENTVTPLKPFIEASLGIYLIHPFILLVLQRVLEFDAFSMNPLYGVPLLAAVTIAGSFISVRMMQRIPVVRSIVPK